jgi:hypothetical protein
MEPEPQLALPTGQTGGGDREKNGGASSDFEARFPIFGKGARQEEKQKVCYGFFWRANAGENPAHRKPKGSCAMALRAG